MTLLGALCAAIATCSAALAVRRDSAVQRRLSRLGLAVGRRSRWHLVSDRDLAQAGLMRSQADVLGAKLVGALCGATIGLAIGAASGLGVVAAIAGGYCGSVLPSLAIERRAAGRRAESDRALGTLVERLEALAASGRPIEAAFGSVARRPTGASILDRVLGRAADAYALGAPLFRVLALEARGAGLDRLAALSGDLERARDLGRGSLAVVRDAKDAARADERARSLEAAAQVEGKLMLLLVGCYLPALLLLVVIPLFISLLDGLFG